MKFHWTDGHTKDLKVGTRLTGIKHNNRRPRSAEFTAWELLMLAANPHYAETIAGAMEVVKPELEG